MNKSLFKASFSLVVLFVFYGCGVLSTPEEAKLKPLEGKVIFKVFEMLNPEDSLKKPEMILSIETEKIYPCSNWSIVSQAWVEGDKIGVDIMGIYIPSICLTALGPATFKTVLDIPEGEYSLYFSYSGITDRYGLSITDSLIRVIGDSGQFTKPGFTMFQRYRR